jgi:poly [ADP-ribose] polymerase
MAKVKVQKSPSLRDGQYTVEKVVELNFFDLSGAKAKTKGTSNKSYHAELQIAKTGSKAQIYSMWGPTGGNQTKDWRYYPSKEDAEKDFASIIKRKKKKGYKEVEVAQRAYGSDAAKQITKAVTLNNVDAAKKDDKTPVCSLPAPTQELIAKLFGSTQQFVATTLKCPLGQLTNAQIDKGRGFLNDAKKIINDRNAKSGVLTKKDKEQIDELTNEFYAAIPHNLGTGSRGQMTQLLLNSLDKVIGKEDDLDTLLDAKSVGAVLTGDATIDAQYKEMDAKLTWIDPKDPLFKFMSEYFSKSKVSGHGYGSAKVKNLWAMERQDKQKDHFLANSERIAKECGTHSFIADASRLNKLAKNWIPGKRPDLDKEMKELYSKANTWLCWHGTRSANVVGITKKGLLIRPAGAVHTGSMFGDGKYFAWQSTKSLNYTDGGYWTGGRSKNTSRFMFLLDVAFGKLHVASRSKFFKGPPKGFHSVYGKAHTSGVYNDEMITYDFKPKDTQSRIRYLFEITD